MKELRAIGIQPDILLCRTDRFLAPDIKRRSRCSATCREEAVITAKDVDTDLRGAAGVARAKAWTRSHPLR